MTDSAQIVIAPDSFKDSLNAKDIAAALRAGWLSVRPQDHIDVLPQADGGEGTLDAVEANIAGVHITTSTASPVPMVARSSRRHVVWPG